MPPAGQFLAGTINSSMSHPDFRMAHVFLRRTFVNDLTVPAFKHARFGGTTLLKPKDKDIS